MFDPNGIPLHLCGLIIENFGLRMGTRCLGYTPGLARSTQALREVESGLWLVSFGFYLS